LRSKNFEFLENLSKREKSENECKISSTLEANGLKNSLGELQERDEFHLRNLENLRSEKGRLEDLLKKANYEVLTLRGMLDALEARKNEEVRVLREKFEVETGGKDAQILGLGERLWALENKFGENERYFATVQMQLKKDYIDAREKIVQSVIAVTDAKIGNIDALFMNVKH
jgi:hypothetical protein